MPYSKIPVTQLVLLLPAWALLHQRGGVEGTPLTLAWLLYRQMVPLLLNCLNHRLPAGLLTQVFAFQRVVHPAASTRLKVLAANSRCRQSAQALQVQLFCVPSNASADGQSTYVAAYNGLDWSQYQTINTAPGRAAPCTMQAWCGRSPVQTPRLQRPAPPVPQVAPSASPLHGQAAGKQQNRSVGEHTPGAA